MGKRNNNEHNSCKHTQKWNHVYPTNDLVGHYLDGRLCWCQPILIAETRVVLHNSMDMREHLAHIIEVLH